MKKLLLLLSTVCLTGLHNYANAQWATWIPDSVNMAPGITKDVFYSLDNGSIKTESSSNWILAMSTSFSTAGVWANQAAGVRVFRTAKHASQWSTISYADTMVEQLFNPDTSWDYGALNAKAAAIFDYGWGKYNTVSHNVYGDSIFIIAQGNNYYQFIIDSMKGSTNDYYTRVAPLGLSNFTASTTFNKAPKFSNSNFIYVTATSMGLADTMREPAKNTWDILFTKYITPIAGAGGSITPYPVKGVLSNRGTKQARLVNIDVESVASNYATYPLVTPINTIGYDWKVFAAGVYTYPENLSYLVESKQGALWQIQFTGYSSATGIMNFNKRKLGAPTAINNVNNAATSFGVYPNPINNSAVISINSKVATQAVLQVTDLQGKIVISKNINIQNGMNALECNVSNLQTGNYILSVRGAKLQASQLITKQ
jgi:hypothetical protein